MSSKTFNVAVIGYGLSAKVFHIPLILAVPAFRLYGIVQRHPTITDDAEKDHPGVRRYGSAEEMVEDKGVDLVVVTTIPDTHVQLTTLALQAGKNVVVEKPFTPTSKEADGLIALAKEKGKLITVYQNRRWDSDYLTLSKILKSNVLGRVVEFETHFDRHRPNPPAATWKTQPKAGNGSIYDLGIHLIDQVVHSFGMPSKVTAFLDSQRQGDDGGIGDSCNVLLHYDSGMTATVKAGVVSCEVQQLRYWIRGEKGSFWKGGTDVQEEQLRAGLKPGAKGFGVDSQEAFGSLTTMKGDERVRETYPTIVPPTYVEFYRILADALSGKGQVPVKAEEARSVIRLIELAQESSKLSKTVDVHI